MTKSAFRVVLGLLLSCVPGACAGPGLEPPSDRGGDSPDQDAGEGPMAGGAAQSGAGGVGGVGGQPPHAGADGSPDSAVDAGEAEMDASVDEDGGSDPEDLPP